MITGSAFVDFFGVFPLGDFKRGHQPVALRGSVPRAAAGIGAGQKGKASVQLNESDDGDAVLDLVEQLSADALDVKQAVELLARLGRSRRAAKGALAGHPAFRRLLGILQTFLDDGSLLGEARLLPQVLRALGYLRGGHPGLAPFAARSAAALKAILAEAGPQELADAAWSMARLACRDAPTLQSIAKHAAALNQQADFRGSGGLGRLEISKLAWAFASLEVHDSNFMEGLARQAAILQRELTQQDLSNLAWACAKLLASNSVLLKVVSEESVNKIKGFKPQELANLIWAVSTLQLQGQASENLFRAVASEATMKLRSFKAQELANLAWAFAKRSHGFQPQPQGQTGLGVGASEMLLALAEQASKAAHEFKAQELSSLVWALAAARVNHQAVLKAVGQQAAAKVRDFTSQGLSNIVQAYAKLDASHVGEQAGVFRAVAQHATPRLSQFKPEELSMLSWSFGKLAVVFEPELFRGMAAQATKISAKLTPQGISNLLYGFAKASFGNAGELDDLLPVLLPPSDAAAQVPNFKLQELSNLAWALAKLQLGGDLIAAAGREVATRLRSSNNGNNNNNNDDETLEVARRDEGSDHQRHWPSQEISNIAWALSSSAIELPELFRAIAEVTEDRLGLFSPQELSNLIWAFARQGVPAQSLLQEMVRQATSRAGEFAPQHLSNIAWSFASKQVGDASLLLSFAEAASEKLAEFAPQGLSNLVWAMAILDDGSIRAQQQFLDDIAHRVAEAPQMFSEQGLCNVLWSFAALKTSPAEACEAVANELSQRLRGFNLGNRPQETWQRLAVDILGAVWALNYLGLDRVRRSLQAVASTVLQRMGRRLDMEGIKGRGRVNQAPSLALGGGGRRPEGQPTVVLDLPDRLVLHKPAGWEVDDAAEVSRGESLSQYLRAMLPSDQWPIISDRSFQCGFMHRLDVPSSGLLLVAKSYQAFYDLELQLHSGSLVRDYLVLVHGWLAPSRECIEAAVLQPVHDRALSRVSSRGGRPSKTNLKVLAHARHASEGATLVALRIVTGRRHQIRAHMSFIGHPIVSDGKYMSAFNSWNDCEWCSRTFLHRYRLAFSDSRGNMREAAQALPPTLWTAATQLTPRNDESSLVLAKWLENAYSRDWESLEAMSVSRSAVQPRRENKCCRKALE
ncbi:unnamed protein product [Polarella glacialis]|uniref:Pseudouridine synthase RsuA/RluA-like domain-containing protein n=1 Tax=Polarella glacialis TaxID=89957 RepID=A0A813HCE2_POLGL|nr:unnamed protein product [Polarella glacialis]